MTPRFSLILALAFAILALPVAPLSARSKPSRAKAKVSSGVLSARESLNEGDMARALPAFKRELDKRPTDRVKAEYGFALALAGLRELSLTQFDQLSEKAPLTGTERDLAALSFRILGYPKLCNDLAGRELNAVAWYKHDLQPQKAKASSGMDFGERALNANRLAAEGQPYLATAEFAALCDERPKEFLLWIGYSLALEKIGAMEAAREAVDKASALAGDDEARAELVSGREAQLKEAASSRRRHAEVTPNQARYMLFGGGQFGSGNSAFNGRFGYFLNPTMDLGVDLGLTPANSTTGSSSDVALGISSRLYWPVKKAGSIALGARIDYLTQSQQGRLTISPGLTSPTGDIFVDVVITKDNVVVGLTVGVTQFFGGK